MSSNILKVIEAYGVVLSETCGAIIYLMFLSASSFAGILTGMLFSIFGYSPMVIIIVVILFSTSFAMAGFSITILFRIRQTLKLFEAPERKTDFTRKEFFLQNSFWILSFIVAWLLSEILIPFEKGLLRIPVMVGLGVSLGNMSIFLYGLKANKTMDPRPLFVFLYLLFTIPSYFTVPDEEYAFMLNWAHLIFSYFVAAFWYLVSARRKALGILHAARREN